MEVLDRIRIALTAGVLSYFLYFFGLEAAGLIGPDEPRYAAIGRQMAHSGDWLTPVLWGRAWFEKPPLLYWMTASGYLAGLDADLAPRLPVALLGVFFLGLFWALARQEFGSEAAGYGVAVLATSAGWVAFSHLAVPDLPLAATFGLAMLFGLRWLSTGHRGHLLAAWFCLGLAVLAKGLVPLVLALPLVWCARSRWRAFFRPAGIAVFLLTAVPWYALCAARHGMEFLGEFFGRHHLERLVGGGIHHPRPWWFYLPILPAAIFPWTPWLVAVVRPRPYADPRRRFLALWVLFGLLFFSASVNKLPGYLLPLLPPLALLVGLALAERPDARWLLASSIASLVVTPLVSGTLPFALASGLSRAPIQGWSWTFAAGMVTLATGVWLLERAARRAAAVMLTAVAATAAVVYLKVEALPEVDRWASGRPLWRQVAAHRDAVCIESLHRNWRYGLDYYALTPLPSCAEAPQRTVRIRQLPGALPVVERTDGASEATRIGLQAAPTRSFV